MRERERRRERERCFERDYSTSCNPDVRATREKTSTKQLLPSRVFFFLSSFFAKKAPLLSRIFSFETAKKKSFNNLPHKILPAIEQTYLALTYTHTNTRTRKKEHRDKSSSRAARLCVCVCERERESTAFRERKRAEFYRVS